MIAHDFISAPAVVVGGGIAGLTTALSLDGCVVATGGTLGDGASQLAQGGIAAAIGSGDTPALHAADTLRVAAGLAAPDIAEMVAAAAPARIDWLRGLGVTFDAAPDGEPALGREAGHRQDRIVHAGGDRTGAAVMRALRAAVRARPDIRVLEQHELVDLITSGARAAGVLLAGADGRLVAVVAPHVVLATGGVGACFDRTTNPATSRGAGLAAAARRGVRLADLEFVQFHPTALAVDGDPLPLLTEALRGAGAVLLDAAGRRFMTAIHPDAELAPRDVVARSVAARGGDLGQVYLDARPVRDLEARFPGAVAAARAAGADPLRQPLPVTTAAHFHMGGIATDARGAASLPGLWACGEVAATGLHGGNRLASNSLLEGLVFGARIAAAIRDQDVPAPRGTLEVPSRPRLEAADPARIGSLRKRVSIALGPSREGALLHAALDDIESWKIGSRVEEDMVAVARLMLGAAYYRRESRGAHYRRDYPWPAALAARSYVEPRPARAEALDAARSRVA